MKKLLRILFLLVSTLWVHKQYTTDRWTEARKEEGTKGKKEGKEFVKAVYILSSSVCVHRVFNQPHRFLFVWLQTSTKSASTFSSVILNKKLPYHYGMLS